MKIFGFLFGLTLFIQSAVADDDFSKIELAPEWAPYSHGYVTTDRWIAMIYAAIKK